MIFGSIWVVTTLIRTLWALWKTRTVYWWKITSYEVGQLTSAALLLNHSTIQWVTSINFMSHQTTWTLS